MLSQNICCPFLVEQNRSRLESVWKLTSPVPLLPGVHGSFGSNRKIHPDRRLRCAASLEHFDLSACDKQPSEPALTHKRCGPDRHSSLLPLQHTRSIPGISPFTGWKRATISPPLEWGRRPAGGTLPSVAWLRLWWEVRASVLAAEGWKPVRSWEEPAALRLPWQLFPRWGFIAQTFHFVPARVCFCHRERTNSGAKRLVISTTLRQRGGEQWGRLLRGEDAHSGFLLKKIKRGIKSQDYLTTQAGKDWNKGVLCAASLMVFA